MNLARNGKFPAIKSTLSLLKKTTINLSILETHLLHCHSFSQFKQILSQMISSGFINDAYAASRVIKSSTDSHFVSLDYSRRIFSCIESPNGFTWNTMMRAHIQGNSPREVMEMYSLMLINYAIPDNFTFPIVIQSCALQFSVFAGKQVHDHVIKMGFGSDVYVNNTLVNMYSVCGDMCSAHKVFDESPALDSVSWNSVLAGYVQAGNAHEAKSIYDQMPEKSIIASNSMIVLFGKLGLLVEAHKLFDEMPDRDMVSWSALVSCYEQNEMCSDALLVFKEMIASGSRIDEVVIVSILSACSHLLDLKQGKGVHGLAIKTGIESYVNLQNACIHMYSVCKEMAEAEKLFRSSSHLDLFSWNSMISGYLKCGLIESAKALFDSMPERDTVSWSAMISGYTQHGCFSESLDLFNEMQLTDIQPDEITLVSVISACTNLAAFDLGRRVHSYIKNNGFRINPILGTTLIDMYMKSSFIEDAMEVFHGMEEKGISTWNSVILGLAMNGQTEKSLQTFTEMKDCGVTPNDITFIGVLGACRHMGLLDSGRLHFNSMIKEHNIQPNVKHYGCMVDLLGRAGLLEEAEELVMSMPMEADVATWGALLGACTNQGNHEMGERIGRKLIAMKPDHDEEIGVTFWR
ncbi:hypothetical protein V2J09_007828 [Rumex salicifolius]